MTYSLNLRECASIECPPGLVPRLVGRLRAGGWQIQGAVPIGGGANSNFSVHAIRYIPDGEYTGLANTQAELARAEEWVEQQTLARAAL